MCYCKIRVRESCLIECSIVNKRTTNKTMENIIMSKKNNPYKIRKKRKHKSKNNRVDRQRNDPLNGQFHTFDATVSESARKDMNIKINWKIVAIVILIVLGICWSFDDELSLWSAILLLLKDMVRVVPHVVYVLAGSLFVTLFPLGMFMLLRLLEALPDKWVSLRKIIIGCGIYLMSGVLCKNYFYPDLFFCVTVAGFVIADGLRLVLLHKKNEDEETLSVDKTSYYVKWLLGFMVCFLIMLFGVRSVFSDYPYKLQGRIKDVDYHSVRVSNSRGNGTHLYWRARYYIQNADGKKIDGANYVGHYDIDYEPMFFMSREYTKQHYMNMEGKTIQVRGAYNYCRGDLITVREEYFMIFICAVCLFYIFVFLDMIYISRKRHRS